MLKDLINTTDPLHTRSISLSTHRHPEAGLIVHGILLDHRRVPIVDILGTPKAPGIIHHITVTLAIAPDPLRILEAEAEMPTIPTPACTQTLDRIRNLIGLKVRPGFSKQIRERIGGPEGCVHLCSLVTAMGTEMIHGWLTEKRTRGQKGKMDLDSLKGNMFLIDSCRVWQEDGPRVQEIRRAIAAQNAGPGPQGPRH